LGEGLGARICFFHADDASSQELAGTNTCPGQIAWWDDQTVAWNYVWPLFVGVAKVPWCFGPAGHIDENICRGSNRRPGAAPYPIIDFSRPQGRRNDTLSGQREPLAEHDARAAGARRFIAQSFAGKPFAREGGPVKTEGDRLDPNPLPSYRRTAEAIRYLESAVTAQTALEGLILRYGSFYGPGTAIGEHGWIVNGIRKRRIPLIGCGSGVWSFIHIDDAARFTAAAVERGAPGIYNIVDDDPAPLSQWLPALAETLSALPMFRSVRDSLYNL
jgi:NAD dependent epimerase/dehydratase family